MKLPSIKTLSAVFADPKAARKVLEMTLSQLASHPAGKARAARCWYDPKWHDVRLHVLDSLDSALHGVEAIESEDGEFADYLNTGDSYAPTVIYWRGRYRVQSIGDFIEVRERQGVIFK